MTKNETKNASPKISSVAGKRKRESIDDSVEHNHNNKKSKVDCALSIYPTILKSSEMCDWFSCSYIQGERSR